MLFEDVGPPGASTAAHPATSPAAPTGERPASLTSRSAAYFIRSGVHHPPTPLLPPPPPKKLLTPPHARPSAPRTPVSAACGSFGSISCSIMLGAAAPPTSPARAPQGPNILPNLAPTSAPKNACRSGKSLMRAVVKFFIEFVDPGSRQISDRCRHFPEGIINLRGIRIKPLIELLHRPS